MIRLTALWNYTVANTNEVGSIKISKYKSKGCINKRLYVEIGD